MAARYIVIEGSEGLGKSTQCNLLVEHLTLKGFKVLYTKEPGSKHQQITMMLRDIMLNNKYEADITPLAREYISQAIRSIHVQKLIIPALSKYDYIIQDRGILSGLAYGTACGNDAAFMQYLASMLPVRDGRRGFYDLYDDVVIYHGDIGVGLARAASCKQEFEAGDAIEAKGLDFMKSVSRNFDKFSKPFNSHKVDITNKSIDDVFTETCKILGV